MDFYQCEVCDVFIKPKNKSKHFKSNIHESLDEHKHIKLTVDDPGIDDIDRIIHTYINEYSKNYEYYLVRCEFKLSFGNMEGYPVASSKLTDIKTTVSWNIFVENLINMFKNGGFDFSHISQMTITIVDNKMDMTYDFHMKNNMEAVERQLNKLINKNKTY